MTQKQIETAINVELQKGLSSKLFSKFTIKYTIIAEINDNFFIINRLYTVT